MVVVYNASTKISQFCSPVFMNSHLRDVREYSNRESDKIKINVKIFISPGIF